MTEAALRAYLLGKLTESEAEIVEQRLVHDADLFSQLEVAEDDLFDAYARGELDADERQRFLERFGHNAARRRFAQAFTKRTTRGRVLPFTRRFWMPLTVAATLLLGVYLLPWRNLVPGGGEAPASEPAAVAAPAPVAASTVLNVPLALGTSRAASAATRISVDRNVASADLAVRLNPADRYAVYGVELRSQAGNIIWANNALHAVQENGDLVMHAIVPADRLAAGTYELTVRGGASASALDDLGFLAIEVNRVP